MKKTSKEYKTEIEETEVKINQLEHREQLLENRMRKRQIIRPGLK